MHYETEQPDKIRATSRSATRRASSARTPDGARMCWPWEWLDLAM
ncbi:hypothetical protein SMD44_08823 [Streptomyces alboflavus]|uniref:Uncharacterized protein n=1 Tax=Streptomyces alboflavus TaxID=67267 RepID=A0A1Z1WSC7_9ACTN|nr:hypothetical protein SMD44_08823 [Streptomyces alboflavus]